MESLDRLEHLFRAAQLHPPEERAAFLDAACADDPALRAEIESLLAADVEAENDAFLAAPPTELDAALEAAAAPRPADAMEGTDVGPYRVLRALGQGGMGDVYLAVREEPFRRYVALKVIRHGTNSHDVSARFAIERQILASLDHSGIARLIDGGVTPAGLPYFAMEYVEGQSITAYCDERRLTIPERLCLFADVCHAVHYAHQNLVLHRDLKPTNILVTARDEVKLLDFGIAKLLNPQLSHLPVPITRAETRMLTPEYASPEQIRGEPLTTTSDVYSLGVLLYELLTGYRPHRLDGRSTHEIIRIVSDEPPVHPSTAVTRAEPDPATRRTAPDEVATARNLTAERLQRRLRGDLDAIALKALRKEPNQRYSSAELLAQDVERHLAQQPVSARRGSRRYRLASFLRRHRVEAAAAAAVFVALVGGLGVALWQAGEAQRERDMARIEAQTAEEVTAFVLGLFERADPTAAPGDTVTVREVLDAGADRVESTLAGQPAVQSELLHVIAHAFENLGRYDRAVGLMERAHALRTVASEPDDEEALHQLFDLAQLRVAQGDYHRAETDFRAYVEAARARYGARDVRVLKGTYRIWGTLHQQGRAASADSLFAALVAMEQALPDDDDDDRAYTVGEIGYVFLAKRRYDESERYLRRALAMEQRLHAGPHPHVADVHKSLASALNQQERSLEALPHATEAVRLHALLFPEGHDQAASGLYQLALTYRGLEEYEDTERTLLDAVAMLRRLHGTRHRSLTLYLDTLAGLYERQGRYTDAEPVLHEVVAITAERSGAEAPATLGARAYLGNNLRLQRRFTEAEAELLDCHEHLLAQVGADHRIARRVAQHLADLYDAWGRPAAAARYRGVPSDSNAALTTG
jgi:serine/threonine-protein kinase